MQNLRGQLVPPACLALRGGSTWTPWQSTERADRALYRVKASGRDSTALATDADDRAEGQL
jgi:hypothetical protein